MKTISSLLKWLGVWCLDLETHQSLELFMYLPFWVRLHFTWANGIICATVMTAREDEIKYTWNPSVLYNWQGMVLTSFTRSSSYKS